MPTLDVCMHTCVCKHMCVCVHVGWKRRKWMEVILRDREKEGKMKAKERMNVDGKVAQWLKTLASKYELLSLIPRCGRELTLTSCLLVSTHAWHKTLTFSHTHTLNYMYVCMYTYIRII